jgi:hypothetical protein
MFRMCPPYGDILLLFAYFMVMLWLRIHFLFGRIIDYEVTVSSVARCPSVYDKAYWYHTELYNLLAKSVAKNPKNFSNKLEGIFLSVSCRGRDTRLSPLGGFLLYSTDSI